MNASWLVKLSVHPLVAQGIKCPTARPWPSKAWALENDLSHLEQGYVMGDGLETFLGGIMATYFHQQKAGTKSLCMLILLSEKAG